MFNNVISTYGSMVSRIIIGLMLVPVILKYDADLVAVWFYGQILNRIRDVFDFGYLDNISREISYRMSSPNKISSLFEHAHKQYFINSCSYFIFSLVLTSIWLSINNDKFQLITLMYLILVSISNSIFLFGNCYLSLLYGLNKISLIKYWDAILNLLGIVYLIIFLINDSTFIVVASLIPVINILAVMRNYFFCKQYRIREHEFYCDQIWLSIKNNSLNDFKASVSMSSMIILPSLFVSTFIDSAVSNVYLFIEQISDHIRNFSRVPFYVSRPTLSRQFVEDGYFNKILAVKMFCTSIALLCFGYFIFCILGEKIFHFIGSQFLFDGIIFICFVVYSFAERISAMINQTLVILTNTVVINKYSINMLAVSLVFFAFAYYSGQIFLIPIGYAVSYFVCLGIPVSRLVRKEITNESSSD